MIGVLKFTNDSSAPAMPLAKYNPRKCRAPRCSSRREPKK